MLLSKPCPPCCKVSFAEWPDIQVPDNFKQLEPLDKAVVLSTILDTKPQFEHLLQPVIDHLNDGNNI